MLLGRSANLHQFWPLLIYTLSLLGMFGVSATYHRPNWNDKWRVTMKRLDHAMIFVLIAGTGTPICVLALPESAGRPLLITMWLATALGVFKSVIWVNSPKWVSAVLYLGVGWIAASYLHELREALGLTEVWLLLTGGIVYSIGAAIYAFHWPNPSPRYFGYHELFHLFVIVGAILHFLVIQSLI